MSTGSQRREALLAALEREQRLGSAIGVLFSQAVADRLGITSSELETLDLFNLYGPMSPSRLAELTGLTSGGVTRLLDRLERAGFVRREPDPHDRRKVILRLQEPQTDAAIGPFYERVAARMYGLTEKYSDEEIQLFVDFFRAAGEVFQEELAVLRGLTPPG